MKRRTVTKLLFTLPIAAQLLHSRIAEAVTTRKGFMIHTLEPTESINSRVQYLTSLGATLVRFPIYFSYEPSIQAWLDKIAAVLSVCESKRTVLVIDVYHPGSITSSTIANVDDFVNKWRQIAQRFANQRYAWFDLCNEPNHPQWREVALRTAQAIRQQGSNNRIVYVAPGTTTREASRFQPLPGINNQTLQFHFYDWPDVQYPTGQCTTLAPYPSPGRTREDLQNRLSEVARVGRMHSMPVYIGEVAIPHYHPSATRFLRDFTSICDEIRIHLSVHSFREADIWNYEKNPDAWGVLTSWLAK